MVSYILDAFYQDDTLTLPTLEELSFRVHDGWPLDLALVGLSRLGAAYKAQGYYPRLRLAVSEPQRDMETFWFGDVVLTTVDEAKSRIDELADIWDVEPFRSVEGVPSL